MPPLATNRKTILRPGEDFRRPVAADAKIHAGAMIVLEGGFAKPGYTAAGLVYDGRAENAVDNTGGADGEMHIDTRRGVFAWSNDASVNATHIGSTAYIVDDQTVAATDGNGTRSPAGTILDVDEVGVWVAK